MDTAFILLTMVVWYKNDNTGVMEGTGIEACTIRVEAYNRSNRKRIVCDFCNFSGCRIGWEMRLLSKPVDAHCMDCRKEWDRKVIVE
jgi:hypothetical protein